VVRLRIQYFELLASRQNFLVALFTRAWRRLGGMEVIALVFCTSALEGDECTVSRPDRFTSGTHWSGYGGQKSLFRNSNPGHSANSHPDSFVEVCGFGFTTVKYRMITNDVSDYINLLVRIAHIICKHSLY
jgi:hypothetical protein